MPLITYNATGDATQAQMNEVETTALNFDNGTTQRARLVEKRFDVGAVRVVITWDSTVANVEDNVAAIDSTVSGLGADLPLASEVATVDYGE